MEELIISAEHEEKNYWRDLWSYRELLYFLAWRDILVRYKQTTVGVAWAVIRPVLQIAIFTFLFQRVAKMSSGDIPYVLLVTGGTLPWGLFASTFSAAGDSLISSSNLISKIYFPRLLVPASTLVVGLVDFAISLSILVVLMIWYRYVPDFRILTLPLFIILAMMASLGAGLWLAALTVKYRDFRFISPFIVQIGFFISPVGFASSNINPVGAGSLFPQSDGRGHRRLSLGNFPRKHSLLLARPASLPFGQWLPAFHRHQVFSPYGKIVRGPDLRKQP